MWACGITKDPPYEGERPKGSYVFFELDKPDQEYYDEVLRTYRDLSIPVLYMRVRRGWHFFGDLRPDPVKNELQIKLRHLNFDGSLNTTLRIKRKEQHEIFEIPKYQGPEPKPNWAKALNYFLTLEVHRQITDYDYTAKRCGLQRYFKAQEGHNVIFYPLCAVCLTALPKHPENKLKHYQDKHRMLLEITA